MQIGRPLRTITVEPLESPVPAMFLIPSLTNLRQLRQHTMPEPGDQPTCISA